MNKRTLVIGDIHGAFKALKQVLERAEITANDTLIFLGDYVDGWSETPKVIDLLIQLKETNNCVFIRGNHDDLFYRWLKYRESNKNWFVHGGQTTVDAYKNISVDVKQKHMLFLEALESYYLDEENRLFVHAGFTSQHGVKREYFQEMFYWDRTLWETTLSLDKAIPKSSDLYPKRLLHYKEIYIGHTPTTRINVFEPLNRANVWNIDTGAAFRGKLTVMDVDSKEYWQSEPVYTFYPEENGRN